MFNRVYPQKNIKLTKFKKSLLKDIGDNINEYQAFQMKNKHESEYILLKKNSIHYKLLTKILSVNTINPLYVNDIENEETNKILRI